MTQIVHFLLRIFAIFVIVVALPRTALGDIAPLPRIPGTQTEMPEPLAIAVAGFLLALAVALTGIIVGRSGNGGRKKIAISLALVIVLVTIGAAVFAQR